MISRFLRFIITKGVIVYSKENDKEEIRRVADDIKEIRRNIVHGYKYYYEFSPKSKERRYMIFMDDLLECMNLKLVGFGDEKIEEYCRVGY